MKIRVRGATLSVKKADSCCSMKDGSVIIVKNLIDSENGPIIVGNKFSNTDDFYTYPIPSSLLGILKVSGLNEHPVYLNPDNVVQKCYLLPLSESESVCVPLLHSV
jgi:hypothetical protein